MPNDLDILVPRNGDYRQDWRLTDNEGEPIDLTGCSVQLDVRYVAGQGSVLTSATVDLHDPVNGTFTLSILGDDLADLPGPTEIVRLAYDLRVVDADGGIQVFPRGQVILVPGVTFA